MLILVSLMSSKFPKFIVLVFFKFGFALFSKCSNSLVNSSDNRSSSYFTKSCSLFGIVSLVSLYVTFIVLAGLLVCLLKKGKKEIN